MRWGLFIVMLMLAACAISPPVQQMAAARSAISTAKSIPGGNVRATKILKSAEQTLQEAARAIEQEHYEEARQKALRAQRDAQRAAKIKQQNH